MAASTDQFPPLAAEFLPSTSDDWRRLVESTLKGVPFDRLRAKTLDGLTIDPLPPRRSDAVPIAGRAPATPWQIIQRVDHPDAAAANAQALDDIENGANGLSLVFAGSIGSYGYGLDPAPEPLQRVLKDIDPTAIAIDLDLSIPSRRAPLQVADWIAGNGFDPTRTQLRCGLDPLRALATTGASPLAWPELMGMLVKLVSDLAARGFSERLVVADGRVIENAGGSEAQELAYVLATGVAYLRALETGGIALDGARRMLFFRLSADADQILMLAKFRSLRKLWARVEQACGIAPEPAFITAETAWRMLARRDPHVNIVRTTIAAAAAGLGGADAVTVLPFTAALGLPDPFARRIARNLQLILIEESNLGRVADPAAGSGAVEALTSDLCAAAWSLFQEIEAAGGACAALLSGLIQHKVAKVRAARETEIATRKQPLTGISEYPNLAEAPVRVLDVVPVPVSAPAQKALIAEPLTCIRLAQPFERLRDASDRMLAATGTRPKIFLATLGVQAEFTPRATFAKNFFAVGGIEAIANHGSGDLAALGGNFRSSGAKLACLCATDEAYAQQGAAAARALADAGATHIYLAGQPGELEAALQSAGIGTFIFAGCDALAALQAAHDRLGIRP